MPSPGGQGISKSAAGIGEAQHRGAVTRLWKNCLATFLKLWGIFHGFEDPVVESFDLFVGITDHKFLLEVF
jgi:hypothetical protein